MNLAALSTREMGPGARHMSLDDTWGGWNWKKILGMGETLFACLSVPRSGADCFIRRISPSELVEGPPYEGETLTRKQEVRHHVLCAPP